MTTGEEIRNHNIMVRAWHLNSDSYSSDMKIDPAFLSLVKSRWEDIDIKWNNRLERWAVFQNRPMYEIFTLPDGSTLSSVLNAPRRLFFVQGQNGEYQDCDSRVLDHLALSDRRRTSMEKIMAATDSEIGGDAQ